MQTPALLPQELLYTKEAATDKALYALLLKKPVDLVRFFASASDDETWTEEHIELMGQLLEWIAGQVAIDKLGRELYATAFLSCRKHYHVLKSVIPKDITILLKDKELPFSSFLLIGSSDFFKDLLQKEILPGESKQIVFSNVSNREFAPVEAFILTGTVPDLSTTGQEELGTLISYASGWGLDELSVMAEESLKKYLTVENCLSMLIMAKSERWTHFARRCADFINDKGWGIRIGVPDIDHLTFEFMHFEESALDKFNALKRIIFELICSGDLTGMPEFGAVLRSFPELYSLDISASADFTDQLFAISPTLTVLNVSECPWISKETLDSLHKICPDIERLNVAANVQLNYKAWTALTSFKKLVSLDMSLCRQLQDEDLRIILTGLKDLRDLSLSKCVRINEIGFLGMAKQLPRLASLDVSRTDISDTALVEIGSRCPQLTEINLSLCSKLTEKGILSLVKQARNLRKIDISRCNLTLRAFQEISQLKPNLLVAM